LFAQFSKRKDIEYHPVDMFAPGYVYPAGTVEMDVTDLKFKGDFFDFVICSHVLEHVPDDVKGISELYRVLRPGGEGIIQVPIDETKEKTFEDPAITDPKERKRIFGEPDHLCNYGRDYVDKLKSVGFEVILVDFLKQMNHHSLFRNGLIPENIYTVRKPV
jgi:ubiquinone/menaquinone biosynthesis C-methylase UbiE